MPFESLLPPDSTTALEVQLERVGDLFEKFSADVESIRGVKLGSPPSVYLPFLIYEYGLGELSPYVPNLYDLIREGVRWQRVRGTHESVYMGLDWLGYSGTLEDPPARRTRWNLFQIALDRVRDDEDVLARIEGVAQLSAPVRSYFWRGYAGYDIRALEYSWSKWAQTLYSTYSGRRIGGQAKWSFGRVYAFDHTMTETELTDLGVWEELPPEDEPLTWGPFPWGAFPWGSSAGRARSVRMADGTLTDTAWVVFKNSDDEVIGARRARALHRVATAVSDGVFQVGSEEFNPVAATATIIYVEALTDFGDGYGETAVTAAVVFDADLAEGQPAGARWLDADQIEINGPLIAETPVAIVFGRTVRERVKFALRF